MNKNEKNIAIANLSKLDYFIYPQGHKAVALLGKNEMLKEIIDSSLEILGLEVEKDFSVYVKADGKESPPKGGYALELTESGLKKLVSKKVLSASLGTFNKTH